MQCACIFYPYAVTVGGANFQGIMSFGKIGVSGGALVPYIIPVFFEPFQLVGVRYVIRLFHVQRCKLNTESILVMWQSQEMGIFNVGD